MLRILESDFYKLGKSRAFWYSFFSCSAFAVFMVTAMYAGTGRGGPAAHFAGGVGAVFVLPLLFPMGFHLTFIAIFSSVFVAAEFGHGTMKNALSKGAARSKVYISKLVVCAFSSVFMLLGFAFAILVSATIAWGFDPGGLVRIVDLVSMVSLQGLMVVAYTALFTFVSMTVRGTGGAIAINVLTVMMASVLLGALSLLFGEGVNLGSYWLEWGVTNLAVYAPTGQTLARGVAIAFAWGIGSTAIGLLLFGRQDVK